MKMKKVCMLLLVCSMVTGVFASPTVGIGAHVGTDSGLDVNVGFDWFELMGHVGIQNFQMLDPIHLDFDLQASGKINLIKAGSFSMPITLGVGMVSRAVCDGTTSSDWKIGVTIPVGVEFQWENFPISLYARFAPGCGFYDGGQYKAFYLWDASAGVLLQF
jgi:hypothetical protein